MVERYSNIRKKDINQEYQTTEWKEGGRKRIKEIKKKKGERQSTKLV